MYDQKLTILFTTSFLCKGVIDRFIYFYDRFWSDCPLEVIISLENEVSRSIDKLSSSSVANKLIFDYNLLLQESKS